MAYFTPPSADNASSSTTPLTGWLDTSGQMQRFIQNMQQAQFQMFQNLGSTDAQAGDHAGHLTRFQDLFSQQMTYFTGEYARLAQLYTQALSSVFNVQSQWTKQLEAGMGSLLGQTVDEIRPANAAFTWPALFGPPGLVQAAQSTWTEMSKVMLGAIRHDLEPAEPAEEPGDETEASSDRPHRKRAVTRT